MQLPVEIKLGDIEQGLPASVGQYQYVFDVLSAKMHVRRKGIQRDILLDSHLTRSTPIVYIGLYVTISPPCPHLAPVHDPCVPDIFAAYQHRIGHAFGQNLVGDWLLREPQTKHRTIFFGTAAWLIVHIELEIHTRADAFGGAFEMSLKSLSRCLAD